jgi:hypothetical protein
VILTVTKKGRRVLDELSTDHATELSEMRPRLAQALHGIGTTKQKTRRTTARKRTERPKQQ